MSKQSCALRGAGLGRGAPGGGDPQMGSNSMGVRTPQMLKQGGGHLPAALPLYSLVNLVLQEYTEDLFKNDLHDPSNQNGVITHLEQDILECEIK